MNSVVIPILHRSPLGIKEQLTLEFIWRFVSPKLVSVMYLLINGGRPSAYLNTTSFFYSLIVGKIILYN